MSDDDQAADEQPAERRSDEAENGRLYLEALRIHEHYRTLRFLIVGLILLGAFGLICWVVVRALDNPPWVQALALLIGALPPSYLVWRMRGNFRLYMQRDHQRIVELESRFDSQRTSSGIHPDGTTPDDT